MTTVFLISEVKLRTFTDLDNNVDTALIKNAIREAQDIKLQYVVGTLLYEKLLDLVETDTIGDAENVEYKTLLDSYIQDFLLYASYYYALDSIYLRARNNGLIKPNGGENSDAVEKSLYDLRRQSVESKLNFYSEKLTKYIIEEHSKFPELDSSNKLYEQLPNLATKFGSPFAFRNKTLSESLSKSGIRLYSSNNKQYPQ